MNQENSDELSTITVTTSLVKSRNALLAKAAFGPLYMDFYLHLMQHEIKHEGSLDAILKRGLTAVTLHAATRPSDEITAWTFNCQEPRLNLFVTNNNPASTVAGRLFTDQVKESEHNLFYSQVVRGVAPARQSVVTVESNDIFTAVETFYSQSQQLPVRIFDLSGEDEFAMVIAMPDCDLAWLNGLTMDAVTEIDTTESLKELSRRDYHFECGCTLSRIVQTLVTLKRADAEDLFGDEDALIITCPRCGARYAATRKMLDELETGS